MRIVSAVLLSLCLAATAAPAGAASPGETATIQAFNSVRTKAPKLRAFLERMPKGADLHNHLSGAIYAESFISWGAQDGLCVTLATMTLTVPPCAATTARPVSDALIDQTFYDQLVNAFSVRSFVPTPSIPNAHDQFFITFGRFGAAADTRFTDMLIEVAQRNANQSNYYLELMQTFGGGGARRIADQVGPLGDFLDYEARLRAAGLYDLIPTQSLVLNDALIRLRTRLGCFTTTPQPGCAVTIRFIAQINRNSAPNQVFAQIALAMKLAQSDPRVVGLNLVAPEDYLIARRDYSQHMQMLKFLTELLGPTPISLHAGELTGGLVPPGDLDFHIREAVEVAGARRIGHGVDLGYETNMNSLLQTMALRQVMVEINLTSNDVILNVAGEDHPFRTYLDAGVPVALSTDDEGVSRSDLTNEYRRAVQDQAADYPLLKRMSRNALQYAFIRGSSLWRSPSFDGYVADCQGEQPQGARSEPNSTTCRAYLAANPKAQEQWRHEGLIYQFEASFLGG
jgi:adenosine deaminase